MFMGFLMYQVLILNFQQKHLEQIYQNSKENVEIFLALKTILKQNMSHFSKS